MFGCDSTVPLSTSMSANAWERGILSSDRTETTPDPKK
jgi:hypothetical protein